MSFIAPAFYYYHAAREAQSVTANDGGPINPVTRVFDSRQSDIFDWDGNVFTSGFPNKRITLEREGDGTPSDGIDTVIVSGHNFPGNRLTIFSNPITIDVDTVTLLQYNVSEAAGLPIIKALSQTTPGDDLITAQISQDGGPDIAPELTELFLTTQHVIGRGPEFGWSHDWRRTQRRVVNDAGVSATSLLGAARKTFTLTWQALEGADRDILLDMRVQTNDFSEGFWFRAPDTVYGTLFMEVDRDPRFVQDAQNPLDFGTADRVTLDLIEALG